MLADLDIEEQFAYFERLNKSADPMMRERAQAELDRLATVDLEKVGPKGYIHGWIFVGAPGVGGRVYHPQHGHGTISRHGKRTIGVRFDSGKEHAFEHGVRPGRVGETSGHFGQRLDGRTGKPVKVPEVKPETPEVKKPEVKPETPEVKKPEVKPKAPKAPKERAPGEARRGDLVLVHTQRLEGTRDGRGRTAHSLAVAQVTSVTRDGKIKEFLHVDSGPGARPQKVSNAARSTQFHVLPQEKINTEAAIAAYRERKWSPGGIMSKPYNSLAEAREAMKPHLREEKPEEPKVPEVPEVKAPREKINYGDQTPATNVERLKPHQLRPGMRLHSRVLEDPNHPDQYDENKPQRWVTLGMVANARARSWSRDNMSPSGGMYHLYDTHGNLVTMLSPNHRIETDADVKPTVAQGRHMAPRIVPVHGDHKGPGARGEQAIIPSRHAVENLGAPAPQMVGYGGHALDPLDPHYGYPGRIAHHQEQAEVARKRGLDHMVSVHQDDINGFNAEIDRVKAHREKYGEPERPKPKTENPDHLALAHAAIKEGRHADAVNHLTSAANTAPDKATRDAILAQRANLAARLMGKPPKPEAPKEPERPMRSAREEVKDATGMGTLNSEHPRGAATDFTVQQHKAVKRAEQGVYRSANGMDGTPTPAAVKALHDAYRTAGAEQADIHVREGWAKLDPSDRDAALTDPVHGDIVLAHLAAMHHNTRVRNDPAASAAVKKSAAEAADKAWRNVHSVQAITDRRERENARRVAAMDRINTGDASGAADLLPRKPDDRLARRIADTITPKVDASLTGKRLQAATAVRDAEMEVTRARLTENAFERRVRARRSLSPSLEASPSVKAALNDETARNIDEWSRATKTHQEALARLDSAKRDLLSAEAEHKVTIGKQQAEVMDGMRAEFDKIGELPKSTEGKDLAKEAGVPRTITRLTGHEKELAREVNKRADILNKGLDSSKRFNRQADIVEATHARLSGTLHPEVQDRLDALYDQARDQRGEGPSKIYRENLTEAINRWKDFQRAKNGEAPRDEFEMGQRETTAIQVARDEPELAARIRAGNKLGGAPRAIESEEADGALPIADLPKPKAPRRREYKEPAENTLEPGAKVTWTHHHEDGTTTERTGRVWSKAPKPSNAQDAAWVTPDERLPSDPYSAIVVHQARRTKKGTPVTFESHDSDTSHSGSLGRTAANIAARHRATGKAFRPIDPLIEAAIEHALSAAA